MIRTLGRYSLVYWHYNSGGVVVWGMFHDPPTCWSSISAVGWIYNAIGSLELLSPWKLTNWPPWINYVWKTLLSLYDHVPLSCIWMLINSGGGGVTTQQKAEKSKGCHIIGWRIMSCSCDNASIKTCYLAVLWTPKCATPSPDQRELNGNSRDPLVPMGSVISSEGQNKKCLGKSEIQAFRLLNDWTCSENPVILGERFLRRQGFSCIFLEGDPVGWWENFQASER